VIAAVLGAPRDPAVERRIGFACAVAVLFVWTGFILRAIAYASLPGLGGVPLTLTLSRKRERGRSGDTGFPLPRQWERVRVRVGGRAEVHSPASGRGDAAATLGSLSHASGREGQGEGGRPRRGPLSRKRERGRSGDTGFPLPRQWKRGSG
jgi:hypothetical protein